MVQLDDGLQLVGRIVGVLDDVVHCHEDNDLALKKVPPDLHHLFERGGFPIELSKRTKLHDGFLFRDLI
jgi:hypothetical protein